MEQKVFQLSRFAKAKNVEHDLLIETFTIEELKVRYK